MEKIMGMDFGKDIEMRKPVYLIVTGGRTFGSFSIITSETEEVKKAAQAKAISEAKLLFNALDEIHGRYKIHRLSHGGAYGADRLAASMAKKLGIRVAEYPAHWKTQGKAAGVIRNEYMLKNTIAMAGKHFEVVLLAVAGGKGTQDMVNRATAAGIRIIDRRDA